MDTETQNTDDTEKYTQLRCLDYMAEYRHCICKWKLSKSDRMYVHFYFILFILIAAFHQFHQYYIHGKFATCKEPKERIKNCIKWKTFRSEEAKKRLLNSLTQEQKNMHTPDPIWTYRSSPLLIGRMYIMTVLSHMILMMDCAGHMTVVGNINVI